MKRSFLAAIALVWLTVQVPSGVLLAEEQQVAAEPSSVLIPGSITGAGLRPAWLLAAVCTALGGTR